MLFTWETGNEAGEGSLLMVESGNSLGVQRVSVGLGSAELRPQAGCTKVRGHLGLVPSISLRYILQFKITYIGTFQVKNVTFFSMPLKSHSTGQRIFLDVIIVSIYRHWLWTANDISNLCHLLVLSSND